MRRRQAGRGLRKASAISAAWLRTPVYWARAACGRRRHCRACDAGRNPVFTEPHWSSEAKTPKVIPVVLEVIERIRHVDIMGLEEHIQRLSRREPKQPTQFRLRETPQPELLDCERLQHSAWQIARGPKARREIVGNVNGHVHARILWGGTLTVKKAQQVRLRW